MRTDYLPAELFKKLCTVMQYENALAIRTSLETGLRIGDVLKITPSDLSDRCISFIAEKTGKHGTVRISSALYRALLKNSGKQWIFEGREASHHRTRQTVWTDLKKACRHFKVDMNIAPHSARKTYAVELYKERGLKAVTQALQHDNPEVSLIYALSDKMSENSTFQHLDVDELAEKIARRVAELLREQLL